MSKPLTEAKHFRRNRGRLVKLWLDGEEAVARIRGVEDDAVTVEADGAERRVPLADITKAVVQVELNRAADEEGEDN